MDPQEPTVGELMTPNPIAVSPINTVHDGLALLRERRLRHLPVIDDTGRLAGLVSEVELFEALREGDRYRPLGDVARPCTRPPSPDGDVAEALAWQLHDRRDATVVVDEDGLPIGIFTDHDALGYAAERLEQGLLVRDVMHAGPVHTVSAGAPFEVARNQMLALGVRHLVVAYDPNEPLGLISWRDLVGRGAGTVRTLLGKALKDTTTETPVNTAIGLMQSRRIGALPVWNAAGAVVGILTRTDVLRHLVRQMVKDDGARPG